MSNNQPLDEMGEEQLRQEVRRLRSELEAAESGYSRRSVLAAAAGLAGAGAAGLYSVGIASAAPSGTFPASGDDPLLKIRADRVRLVPRTSDPSGPDDGVMWYRGDL